MDNEIFNTFDASREEQGAREWKTFNAVTHDRTSIFHALYYKPKKRKESAIRFGDTRMFVLKHS
jgi:hypothetical protein